MRGDIVLANALCMMALEEYKMCKKNMNKPIGKNESSIEKLQNDVSIGKEKMKCRKPLIHNPQFEGKHHCNHCEREAGEGA